MNQKIFSRNCPKCNIILKYTTSSSRNEANRKQRKCHKCALVGTPHTEEHKQYMSALMTGK